MNRVEVSGLKLRLELAQNRLRALDLERPRVESEITHLSALIAIYEDMPYDSIMEEQSITNKLLDNSKDKKSKRPHSGGKKKGESRYTEAFEAIFAGAVDGLSNSQITKDYNELTGDSVVQGTVQGALNRFCSQGKIRRDPDTKKYYWIGVDVNDEGIKNN